MNRYMAGGNIIVPPRKELGVDQIITTNAIILGSKNSLINPAENRTLDARTNAEDLASSGPLLNIYGESFLPS